MRLQKIVVLAAFGVIPLTAPLLAQGQSRPKDPNEKICEKQSVVGSRLAVRRVCATRAEWAEKRRLDREAVDQAQRGANGPCQTVNTHTG